MVTIGLYCYKVNLQNLCLFFLFCFIFVHYSSSTRYTFQAAMSLTVSMQLQRSFLVGLVQSCGLGRAF